MLQEERISEDTLRYRRQDRIVYFERTTDRVHDSEVAKRMVDRSMEAGNVITVIGDGAYESIGFISREERDRTYYKAKEGCKN
jgi:hypothetical protein